LQKAGVNIKTILKDNYIDGFETKGKSSYEGGKTLSSWGDHRNLMSLFIFSLRTKKGNIIDSKLDNDLSFPEFFSAFESIGAKFQEVN
jgi:3-phosphoshikimate 1-carboxyvinyltransferase